MKGLELAEDYFHAVGMPMLLEKFHALSGKIAAGLVGDGSECFGFDDEISMDHDWGPGFCLWLEKADFDKFGDLLETAMADLPKTFDGYGPRAVSPWGFGRIGVFEISSFYANFTGLDHIPGGLEEWLYIPENSLAACTNGKVFYDLSGEFSRWREALLAFYPEDVLLKKIASRCMTLAQFGQYNFMRCVKRKELVSARYAETKFCADAISIAFLLNKSYAPFFKWMHRGLLGLPILGKWLHAQIQQLMTTGDWDEKGEIIEQICRMIVSELRHQGLSDSGSPFLLDHGPVIQSKIRDENLRQRNVWVG
jgi:hypothetical protein